MGKLESMNEYSQENSKKNFESQEAMNVINTTKKTLLSLKNDIINKKANTEIKGWDANEALKASEYLGKFYTIKKEKVTENGKIIEKERVYFNLDNVREYLQTVHKRLKKNGAPGYGKMSKESTFNGTILAVQIALESIQRKGDKKGTYDVGTINGQLNTSTINAIRDFQRDFIGGKGVDGKPGKYTIGKILQQLNSNTQEKQDEKERQTNYNPGSTKMYSRNGVDSGTTVSGNVEYELSTATSFCGITLDPNGRYDIPGVGKNGNKKLTKRGGIGTLETIIEHNGQLIRDKGKHKETYYSETVLPGGGLKIPGRHVAVDGTIRDKEGYIVVAADLSYAPRDSLVMTTLGPGKVYDTGTGIKGAHFDIYVNSKIFK